MKRIFLSVLAGLMACTMLASCARRPGNCDQLRGVIHRPGRRVYPRPHPDPAPL